MVIHRDTEWLKRKHLTEKNSFCVWLVKLLVDHQHDMIIMTVLLCDTTRQASLLLKCNKKAEMCMHELMFVRLTLYFLLSPSFNFPRAIWQVHNIPYFVFLMRTCMYASFFKCKGIVKRKTSYHCLLCRLVLPIRCAFARTVKYICRRGPFGKPTKNCSNFDFIDGSIPLVILVMLHTTVKYKEIWRNEKYDDYYMQRMKIMIMAKLHSCLRYSLRQIKWPNHNLLLFLLL